MSRAAVHCNATAIEGTIICQYKPTGAGAGDLAGSTTCKIIIANRMPIFALGRPVEL